MALKSSGARAQKRNKTKSLFKFKSRGHTGVIIRCRGLVVSKECVVTSGDAGRLQWLPASYQYL